VDFTRDVLVMQILRCLLRRREEQFGISIDGRAIFFFGPWQSRIMGSQTCFDVRDGYTCGEPSERSTKRTRRVALHGNEVGRTSKTLKQRGGHQSDMCMRIRLARAAEAEAFVPTEQVSNRVDRLLIGKDDQWGDLTAGKSMGHWR